MSRRSGRAAGAAGATISTTTLTIVSNPLILILTRRPGTAGGAMPSGTAALEPSPLPSAAGAGARAGTCLGWLGWAGVDRETRARDAGRAARLIKGFARSTYKKRWCWSAVVSSVSERGYWTDYDDGSGPAAIPRPATPGTCRGAPLRAPGLSSPSTGGISSTIITRPTCS